MDIKKNKQTCTRTVQIETVGHYRSILGKCGDVPTMPHMQPSKARLCMLCQYHHHSPSQKALTLCCLKVRDSINELLPSAIRCLAHLLTVTYHHSKRHLRLPSSSSWSSSSSSSLLLLLLLWLLLLLLLLLLFFFGGVANLKLDTITRCSTWPFKETQRPPHCKSCRWRP